MKLSKQQLELLKLLKKLWEKYPEFRFGQLLGVIYSYEAGHLNDPFYKRDEDVIKYLK